MKDWRYIIIWKNKRNMFVDGHCFKTMAEATTYASIELTQMEREGFSYGIQSIETI